MAPLYAAVVHGCLAGQRTAERANIVDGGAARGGRRCGARVQDLLDEELSLLGGVQVCEALAEGLKGDRDGRGLAVAFEDDRLATLVEPTQDLAQRATDLESLRGL